ncbi:S9 family peptidase [Kribbella sandramycini]|uniref:Dipeptidyl-peptidase-4 n=1 Tax=Kribbella sandramycini TaxID=60450 RepID=A0A7Y4KWX4_9ACTN|nr:prolyl oligopeptidase family serine peptidase [Kribbella sandramycini]MBB6570023.1 dipeptidyl-peptidase-4 [Kribbella sandramycini]NOL40153.1 S9 family peptidase [Kribbella sandramycini]
MTEDLPRQYARTRRFSAGAVSNLAIRATGRFVTFLRDDGLWVFDVASGAERRIGCAGPHTVGGSRVCLQVADGVSVIELETGFRNDLQLGVVGAARIDPTGRWIAFTRDGALEIIGADGLDRRRLAEPDGEAVSWGMPEFAARMSMGRESGFWWSPDGSQLLVARVDESQVELRYLPAPTPPTEPAPEPSTEPSTEPSSGPSTEPSSGPSSGPAQGIRYPAAGTANADVRLSLIDLDGRRREVEWDRAEFEYLVQASWSTSAPLFAVQSRDQRRLLIIEADPTTGATTLVREVTDEHWVDLRPGTPKRTPDGLLVWIERDVDCDTDRLLIGSEFVTPPGLQVAEIRSVAPDGVAFLAQSEPTELHLYLYDGTLHRLTDERGVHSGSVTGGTVVRDSRTMTDRRITVSDHRLETHEERALLDLDVDLVAVGPTELRAAVFHPSWHQPGTAKLPVLLNPYAGPGFQLVLAYAAPYYAISRWFAEQGFVVISTDGLGTPGRGPAYERAVQGDSVTYALDDQVTALEHIAAKYGDLDLDRVAFRGWSYSGFLAAAAVIHRPDVFHAAVVGAAVSDQRGYDSYWKERFLGDPAANPDAYRRSSLLPYATKLTRPMLIVQGLADTNVWPTHALRLSAALTAAGKPHDLITLPGEGHRIADEETIADLLYQELAFLRRSLG